jgi:carbamoyl-phosphate synthase large subunit|tara:strand:+ start:16390 stop:17430 length:1041 start_codon:yes stop_codon:yes gene_type:complete
MKKINILVTGAGSGVGQSILKSLKISKLKLKIIASDINIFNAALFRYDDSIVIPKVEDKDSLKKFIIILKKYKIKILFVGSEYETQFFSIHKSIIEKKTDVMICVSPLQTINIAGDKYLTFKFLKDNDLPFAMTYIPKNLNDAKKIIKKCRLPVFLKDRFGTSSRNIFLIKKKKDLDKYFNIVPNSMIQEYAGYKGNELRDEYTCSLFFTKEKKLVGPFIARRVLKYGTSWTVEVKKFDKFNKFLVDIAKLLPSVGSLNIQFRDGPKGPIPFEFNARFSGTTSIRSYFGFNEPEMFIKNYYLNKIITNPKIKNGIVLRYIDEVFLNDVDQANKKLSITKGKKKNWF